jgi:hypothetical protein
MQSDFEPQGELAVSSGERSFTVSLRVDWNRNGLYNHALSDMSEFVYSATTDRALQGAAPQELGFVSGSAAAELRVVLAGEDSSKRNLVSIFSPYQINSPFWTLEPVGCEIEYSISIDTPLGLLTYPQFIGNIRTISPDRGSNSVEITALDRVEVLRKPVTFPQWAVSERHVNEGRTLAQLMESHYLIDHAIRHCDVSTSPVRPFRWEDIMFGNPVATTTQFFASGNGGKPSIIGWEDNPTRQQFPDTENGVLMYEAIGETHPLAPFPNVKPRVFAAIGNKPDDDMLLWWVKNRDGINLAGSVACGFTLIKDIGQNASWYSSIPATKVAAFRSSDEQEYQIWMEAGTVWSEFTREGPSPLSFTSPAVTIPADDIVHIHVCWDVFHASGPQVYVEAEGNNSGVQDVGPPVAQAGSVDELAGLVEISHQVAMQDIYFTTTDIGSVGTGTVFKPQPATYAASLDPGLNRLSFMPMRNKPQAWDVCKTVADAEMGAVFWTEDGKFVFWNFDTMLSKAANVVREITLDEVRALNITRSLDSVRNVYALDKQKSRSITGVIYASQDVDEFYVPARTEKRFELFLDTAVSPLPAFSTRYKTIGGDPVSAWSDSVQHGYVLQFEVSPGVWEESEGIGSNGVDITSYYNEDGHVVVKIWNGWELPVRLASGDGDSSQPAFHLGGSHVIDYDPQTEIVQDAASVAKFKSRALDLTGEMYQDLSNYTNVVSKFLAKTNSPVPSSDSIVIPGDPRLQLGDAVRLRDKTGFGDYFDVQIYGITRSFSLDEGLTDTLAVQMIPAGGKWDDPIYGIWGSTFVWT